MVVLFNGSTVFTIALVCLAAGAVLGSVLTLKAKRYFGKTKA